MRRLLKQDAVMPRLRARDGLMVKRLSHDKNYIAEHRAALRVDARHVAA
jgi:hypothetical protein